MPALVSQRSQYELKDTLFADPHAGFYSLMDTTQTLPTLLELLLHPAAMLVPGMATSIQKILAEFLTHVHGLVYLTSRSEVTLSIVRTLIDSGDQAFGVYLGSCVRVFSCLDSLFHLCKDKTRFNLQFN
jgi:hypothetical protein